jgi:hypothetical protein
LTALSVSPDMAGCVRVDRSASAHFADEGCFDMTTVFAYFVSGLERENGLRSD